LEEIERERIEWRGEENKKREMRRRRGEGVSVGALDPIRLGILYTDNCNHIYY